jgi:hypothetical protein
LGRNEGQKVGIVGLGGQSIDGREVFPFVRRTPSFYDVPCKIQDAKRLGAMKSSSRPMTRCASTIEFYYDS